MFIEAMRLDLAGLVHGFEILTSDNRLTIAPSYDDGSDKYWMRFCAKARENGLRILSIKPQFKA